MDEDHSVALYDIKRGIKHKKDPLSKDTGLMCATKITKNEVFDMKFIPGDW